MKPDFYKNQEYTADHRFSGKIDRLGTNPAGSGGGGAITLPFMITDVSPDASTPTIRVTYGTVMDILPTDVDTDVLVTDDATTTFYLECTLNLAGSVTAVDLLTGSLPADSDYAAYLLVGVVTAAGGLVMAINQSLLFSQGFKACDRVVTEGVLDSAGTYEFFVR